MSKKSLISGLLIVLAGLVAAFSFNINKSQKLVSPGIDGGKVAGNLWIPKTSEVSGDSNFPQISAKAAFFVDIDSGQVFYQKNIHERLPIASLTKIMTAIVSLENTSFNKELQVSSYAASMEPDHMQLIAGEKLTTEELLYGVFLVSANDGAEALAENSAQSRDQFVSWMNKKAVQLGMKDTVFINPTGLQEDGKTQYSTAYDTALMSHHAITKFPHLVDISSTYHQVIPKTPAHQDYDLYSGINLLTTYPGVLGLKTGYTPEAGMTLVTFAQKNGYRVLGVILNSDNRREEAKALLDHTFSKLGV